MLGLLSRFPVLSRSVGSICAGLLIFGSFPPRPWWFLAPLGLALLTLVVRGSGRLRAGFGYGFLAGLAFFVPLLPWTGIYVGPVPWLALSTVCAVYIGLFGLLARMVGRLPGWPLWVALAWASAEWARSSFPFGGFPWGRLAFGQADGWYLPLASLGGAPFVSFAVALTGAGAAALLLQLRVIYADALPAAEPRPADDHVVTVGASAAGDGVRRAADRSGAVATGASARIAGVSASEAVAGASVVAGGGSTAGVGGSAAVAGASVVAGGGSTAGVGGSAAVAGASVAAAGGSAAVADASAAAAERDSAGGGAEPSTGAVAAERADAAVHAADEPPSAGRAPQPIAGSRRAAWLGCAAAAATLAVLPLAGLLLGATLPAPDQGDRVITVAAIQGSVPRLGLDFNAQRRAVLDNHVRRTEELAQAVAAGAAKKPDVVIWPENSSDIDPLRNADAAALITRASERIGAPILVGAVLVNGDRTTTNSVIVWNGAAGPGERHDKKIIQPFGEYLPMRSFFRLFSEYADRAGYFVPGHGDGVVRAAGIDIGVATCYEVAFDRAFEDAMRAGAQLLTVPTNNATFGDSEMTYQQLAMSRVRAVEHGRALVVAATSGVSAIIAADGTVQQESPQFVPAALVAQLPLRSSNTVATFVGPLPERVFVALTAAAVLAVLIRQRRARRAQVAGKNVPQVTVRD
ncbi:apolipoprotein N-acyltransferase [Nocardia brasiliensis]|uniref:apolipoprotein N-acyltransferase n=1 Tax=Nocardia brasiliensis TaxID=37326 RepID=UPI0024542349|nr:apolipoprotein N-acyltransferase [Nocardia brasiliensis]